MKRNKTLGENMSVANLRSVGFEAKSTCDMGTNKVVTLLVAIRAFSFWNCSMLPQNSLEISSIRKSP
jgi:hypothetical protein